VRKEAVEVGGRSTRGGERKKGMRGGGAFFKFPGRSRVQKLVIIIIIQ